MLRLTFLTTLCLVLLITLPFLTRPGLSQTTPTLLRITTTSEEIISLNPSISGDGSYIAFESTGNLAGSGESHGFRTFRANVAGSPVAFAEIALARAVTPAISQDGSRIAFASTEDLAGRNANRNSEIFLFDGVELKQITDSSPTDPTTRLRDGNFQPSISDDGRLIAFSSNRNLVGQNADQNFEIFLFDVEGSRFIQTTSSVGMTGATNAKLSGDGSRVAYLSENEGEHELLLHDLGTGTKERIAVGSLSLISGRAISDDGLRVVYARETGENQTQVFLFDKGADRVRQITTLGTRVSDVPLNPTISGDGKRIAFATRRSVVGQNSDNSVELYLYDIPTATFTKLTNAPARATADVIASLNDDGSRVVFNFPRIMSGSVADNDHENNSEIYLLATAPRLAFGELIVLNGAALGNEPSTIRQIAPDSIAVARGNALASDTMQAERLDNRSFPLSLAGTTVTVSSRPTQLLFVSPTQVNFVVPPETSAGLTDVIVTNSDGFRSTASIDIVPVAPGLFTTSGDGRGEGIALNADTFMAGPFDPSDGRLRLILFATGVRHRHASQVSVLIAGQSLAPEAVLTSPDFPGLDEIHIQVPPDLRGTGALSLVVTSNEIAGNPVGLNFAGSALRDIMINEILADPPDGLTGDANRDGIRDSSHDEFVELVNTTSQDLDIGGFQLLTRGPTASNDSLRHRFAAGTVLPAGTAIVVFGGGNPDPADASFGNAQILKASTGGLSLLNSGAIVTLRDATGAALSFVGYGGTTGLRGDANQSLTRFPDVEGPLVLHQTAPASEGRLFSPGTRVDGSFFLPTIVPMPGPSPSPSPIPSPSVIPSPVPSPSPTSIPPVVISQIYGGGGNSGAPFRNDFIEIFNRGTTPVDLTGWSVQYAGATSATWSVTPLTSAILGPGQYYLIQEGSGGNIGASLPSPDASGTIAMAATAGKVALVRTTSALTGSCPASDNIVDLVGYGSTSTCFEGAGPTAAPGNTTAVNRNTNGCSDTQNNLADFTIGPPAPRNTAFELAPCPGQSALNVDADSLGPNQVSAAKPRTEVGLTKMPDSSHFRKGSVIFIPVLLRSSRLAHDAGERTRRTRV